MFRLKEAAVAWLGAADRDPLAVPAAHACPSLDRALRRAIDSGNRPAILDLGPLCGDTVIGLAARGARVAVEQYRAPRPTPAKVRGQPDPVLDPVLLAQEADAFEIVIAWEQADRTPPDRLREFGAEIARVLAPAGVALLFCRDSVGRPSPFDDPIARWRLCPDGQLFREVMATEAGPRWVHANRDIERAFAPLRVEGVHLQRNRVREILLRKS